MRTGRAALELGALPDRLPEVISFLARFWADESLPPDGAFPFELSLEELFLNVATHGVKERAGPAHVLICLERDGHRVQATVEDDGKAFDPFSLGTPDIDAGLDDRAVGGLGVHLVKELMDEFDYRFLDGRNRVRMAKTLQG